ncbi:MAG: hypothetical protein ACR2LM_10530 [Pyrinomonadaceae bacterium]
MIRKRLLGLALIALLSPTLCGSTRAQEVKLYPVDEAYKDRSFKLFRGRLKAALKRRDRKFLLSILDKRIRNSWGGAGGVKEFVDHWNLNSANSKVWAELLTILSMGGSFVKENGKTSFYAPYVSSRWDTIEKKLPRDLEDFCCGAVIATKVKMHSQPGSAATILAILSYDVVKVDYEGSVLKDASQEDFRWVKIKTLKGQDGYVRGDQVRSPIGLRASFKKVRGNWVMDNLVGGD